jgi:hypothetical protein
LELSAPETARDIGIFSVAEQAEREQRHEVRVGRPLPTSLVDLHDLILAADNPNTWHVGKRSNRRDTRR